jgi:ATP-dependent DNA ligase
MTRNGYSSSNTTAFADDLAIEYRITDIEGAHLLWLNGTDLRSLPLSERRQRLQAVLPQGSRALPEVLSVEGRGRQLFELICAHDLEGIVAKRLGDPYGSRTRWLKIKNRDYSQAEGRADLLNRKGK